MSPMRLRDMPGRRWTAMLGAVAILALAGLLWGAVAASDQASRRHRAAEAAYTHTLDILLATSELRTAVGETLRGERGYLLTGDPRFLEPYWEGRARVPTLLARLERLTARNPTQRENLPLLSARLAALQAVLDRAVALQGAGRENEAMRIVRSGQGREAMIAVDQRLAAFERAEQRLLDVRRAGNEAANRRADWVATCLAVKAALLLGVAGFAGFQAFRTQRRLVVLAAELARTAGTDALTGLPNRRAFWTALEAEVPRAARASTPLSCAILDIDHFKRINDAYGHLAGDAVLAAVAERMRRVARGSDMLGRIGGEEFAILMPGAGEAEAATACERLRRALEAEPVIIGPDQAIAVTVSTGVALLAPGEPGRSLLSRADHALYRAKQAGRNRMELAA